MRAAIRWCAGRSRTWVALGAAAFATWLASRDHRAGWTVVVGVVTALLAVAVVVGDYADTHPDRAERRAAREQAAVDAVLRRYEREAVARERARRPPAGGEENS